MCRWVSALSTKCTNMGRKLVVSGTKSVELRAVRMRWECRLGNGLLFINQDLHGHKNGIFALVRFLRPYLGTPSSNLPGQVKSQVRISLLLSASTHCVSLVHLVVSALICGAS